MGGYWRAVSCSVVLVLFQLLSFTQGKDYLVGGKTDAWKTAQSDSLNQWAQTSRFQIGDSLVWNLESEKESVLEVTKEGYVRCNSSSPIEAYKNGNGGETKVKLDRSGPFYFISGAEGQCQKGQKLVVVVMSHRHAMMFAAAPSPAEFDGPAIAPTSSATTLRTTFMVVLFLLLGFGFM